MDTTGTDFPRYAIFRKRKVRVLSYEGNGYFMLLDTHDEKRFEHRDKFQFISEKKPEAPVAAVVQPTLF